MISILIPTLNRPLRVRSLLDSANNTLKNKSGVEFLFYVDTNDRLTDESNITNQFKELNIKFFRRDPVNISGQRYNFLASQANGDILMYNSDDMLFQSRKWEYFVEKRFSEQEDRILLLVPHFLNKHKRDLAIVGFVSRRHIDAIGSLFTEYFTQWFDDLWLSKTYKALGRFIEEPKIHMVHNHYSYNKTYYDDTYRKYLGNGNESINRARQVFHEKSNEIEKWIEKLKKYVR